jgi:Kef-type K+ transport system membrane component KefB
VDAILLSIHPNDPLWIAIAFVFGLLLRMVGLPPLIGFLVAGFLLHALGAEADEFLYTIADMGITILLFSIGLKLRPQALAGSRGSLGCRQYSYGVGYSNVCGLGGVVHSTWFAAIR